MGGITLGNTSEVRTKIFLLGFRKTSLLGVGWDLFPYQLGKLFYFPRNWEGF